MIFQLMFDGRFISFYFREIILITIIIVDKYYNYILNYFNLWINYIYYIFILYLLLYYYITII